MKNLIYYNLFLLFLIQFINQVIQPIPLTIIAILYIITFFISTKENILGIYLFLLMFSTEYLLYLTNIIFVIFLLWHHRNNISFGVKSFLIIILIFFESIHVLINSMNGINESLIKLLGFLVCIIPFSLLNQLKSSINIKTTFNLLLSGFIAFSLITIGTYKFDYNVTNFFYEIRRFGYLPNRDEDVGILINPNAIGKNSAFIIATYITLLNLGYLRFNYIRFLLILYVALIGALTLSRTFILLLLIIIILYIINQLMSKKIFKAIFLTMIVCSIFLFTKMYFKKLLTAISKRVFETNDISGGRLEIYKSYIDILVSNETIILFGVGMQNYLEKIQNIDNFIDQASHNVIIEILTIWGVIGLIIVLLYLTYFILSSSEFIRSSMYFKILRALPAFTIILSSMFGQFFISYYYTFGLMFFALIILNIKKVSLYA